MCVTVASTPCGTVEMLNYGHSPSSISCPFRPRPSSSDSKKTSMSSWPLQIARPWLARRRFSISCQSRSIKSSSCAIIRIVSSCRRISGRSSLSSVRQSAAARELSKYRMAREAQMMVSRNQNMPMGVSSKASPSMPTNPKIKRNAKRNLSIRSGFLSRPKPSLEPHCCDLLFL